MSANHTGRQYLLRLLAENSDKQTLEEMLHILLTDKEQQAVINRLQIFARLQQGQTQREISAQLGVGIATVSRGAKIMQQENISSLFPGLTKVLQ